MKKLLTIIAACCIAMTFGIGSASAQEPTAAHAGKHAKHSKHSKHAATHKHGTKKSAHKKSVKKHHA